MKRRGFVLTECLIAAAFASIFLPLLTSQFNDNIHQTVELRRSQEAWNFASSSLERAQALRDAGDEAAFALRRTTPLGEFTAEVAVVSDLYGTRAAATVAWPAGSGMRQLRLERSF